MEDSPTLSLHALDNGAMDRRLLVDERSEERSLRDRIAHGHARTNAIARVARSGFASSRTTIGFLAIATNYSVPLGE